MLNEKKQRFVVRFEGECIIELDNHIINVVDNERRSQFYKLYTPRQIAEHIAFNLVINRVRLSRLDGWADQDDEAAVVVTDPDWDVWAYIPES